MYIDDIYDVIQVNKNFMSFVNYYTCHHCLVVDRLYKLEVIYLLLRTGSYII